MLNLRIIILILTVKLYTCQNLKNQMTYSMGVYGNVEGIEKSNVIRVGSTMSMSIDETNGLIGKAVANAWDLFFEWLNVEKRGIMINHTVHYMSLIYTEDYLDPNVVKQTYIEMEQSNQTDFFFGPFSSKLTAIAASVTDPKGKLMMAPIASNVNVFKGKTYTFGVLPPNSWLYMMYLFLFFISFTSLPLMMKLFLTALYCITGIKKFHFTLLRSC